MINRPAAIDYEPAQAWDRWPGEGARPHVAFVIYRDLGPVDRSLASAAQATGKSLTLMKEWSRRNRWVARAAAWDAENQRISRVQRAKGIEEMARRQALIGQLEQQRAWQRLSAMTDAEVKAMSPGQAIRLLVSGVQVERQARSEVGTAAQVAGTGPIGHSPMSRNSVIEYVRQHPDRLGPVLEALRQLSLAMSDVGGVRTGDATRDDPVDHADQRQADGEEYEGPVIPYQIEGSRKATRPGTEVADESGIPRGMPGFVTRRGLSRA